MRKPQKKIVVHRIEDVVDFGTMLFSWMRSGMDEIYALFDNPEPFQYKQIVVLPDESKLEEYERIVSHKFGIQDRLEKNYRKIIHWDEALPGNIVLLDPFIAYMRELERSSVSFEDVVKEMGGNSDAHKDLSFEDRVHLLRVNIGSFEAGCSSLSNYIMMLAEHKQVKLQISDGALK